MPHAAQEADAPHVAAPGEHALATPTDMRSEAPAGLMRRGLVNVARGVLLGGPTMLAFFTGGYFDAPRVWAGLIAWVLVVVAMVACPSPLPRRRAAVLALSGLALLAGWTLISIAWAPIAGDAYHAGQRLVLYVGMLLAATALLRTRGAQRAVEPALAAGVLIVIGYGLAGRLLPGLLHFQRSVSAGGRLEQPLTYWNAMGELAAIGVVLAVRLAGDVTRSAWLRIASAAATAPLGMGLYLAFSRGALFACAAGLVALIVSAPSRAQLRALLLSLCVGGLAALAVAPFSAVSSLAGSPATREREGAIALGLLAVIVVAAALARWHLTRGEPEGDLRLPRRASVIALGVVCSGLGLAVLTGAKESSTQSPLASGASRLSTLQSDRYDYWRVALRAFGEEPVRGVGAGGWSVYWLRLRRLDVGAQDAHSLPLQTAAELGLLGLALLAMFFWGVAAAARVAHRSAPVLAAGPLAGFVAYAAHAPLDWDWEMPALTLAALVLAGSLLALSEEVSRRGQSTFAPLVT